MVQRQQQLVQLQLQPGLRGRGRGCHDGQPQQRHAAHAGDDHVVDADPARRPQPQQHVELPAAVALGVPVTAPAPVAASSQLCAHRVQLRHGGHPGPAGAVQRHPVTGRVQRAHCAGVVHRVVRVRQRQRQAAQASASPQQRAPPGAGEEVRPQQQQVLGLGPRQQGLPQASLFVLMPHRHGAQEQQEWQPAGL